MADPQPYPGAPRWVKICTIAALIGVALFVAVHLGGSGPLHLADHGAGRAPTPHVDGQNAPRP